VRLWKRVICSLIGHDRIMRGNKHVCYQCGAVVEVIKNLPPSLTTDFAVEFNITFFGLSEEASESLLDFYTEHAYGVAKRHNLDTPALMSRRFPTEEYWEEVMDCEAHDACGGHSKKEES
jgi:hypothetical protein